MTKLLAILAAVVGLFVAVGGVMNFIDYESSPTQVQAGTANLADLDASWLEVSGAAFLPRAGRISRQTDEQVAQGESETTGYIVPILDPVDVLGWVAADTVSYANCHVLARFDRVEYVRRFGEPGAPDRDTLPAVQIRGTVSSADDLSDDTKLWIMKQAKDVDFEKMVVITEGDEPLSRTTSIFIVLIGVAVAGSGLKKLGELEERAAA